MEKESIKIKPGNYRTYIASAGVKDLLDMLSWNGISEASIQRGQSALCNMKNENSQLLFSTFFIRSDVTMFLFLETTLSI